MLVLKQLEVNVVSKVFFCLGPHSCMLWKIPMYRYSLITKESLKMLLAEHKHRTSQYLFFFAFTFQLLYLFIYLFFLSYQSQWQLLRILVSTPQKSNQLILFFFFFFKNLDISGLMWLHPSSSHVSQRTTAWSWHVSYSVSFSVYLRVTLLNRL